MRFSIADLAVSFQVRWWIRMRIFRESIDNNLEAIVRCTGTVREALGI